MRAAFLVPSWNSQKESGHDIPGDHAGGATPVPIPNTEVKSSRADDTAAARLWESRALPGSSKAHGCVNPWAFLLGPSRTALTRRHAVHHPDQTDDEKEWSLNTVFVTLERMSTDRPGEVST